MSHSFAVARASIGVLAVERECAFEQVGVARYDCDVISDVTGLNKLGSSKSMLRCVQQIPNLD